MLDINKIIDNKADIKKALLKRVDEKELDTKLNTLIAQYTEKKELIQKVDVLKAERNKNSKVKPTPEIIESMKTIGKHIKDLDDKIKQLDTKFTELMASLPNTPANDVVAGGKENNKVVKTYGKKVEFDFEPKDHVELAENLNVIDYKRGVKMSGAGFWCYKGLGAELEWALLNYFVDFHRKNGYTFLIPPYLLTEKSAYTSGHLPKFRDDLFWTEDKLCLNATSEMMVGNYHRDEILDINELPLKYYAFSTCFRREAGSYGKDERGMVRGHQFNKIEMFQFTKPENSEKTLDELVKNAEKLVEDLDLHFQTSLLAADDASAAMSKTLDIEVWIPSMEIYKEVSSASNALDYQARRGNIRYKDTKTGKKEYLHTLNASGLATSRIIPAILENNQQKDGSVKIPKVLWPYMAGTKVIKIKK